LRDARRAVRLAAARPDLLVMAELSLGRALLRTWREEAQTAFERAARAGRAGSGLVHAAVLGQALARGEDTTSEVVRASLRGLEAWGDRRLLSYAFVEVRAFVGCSAWTSARTEGTTSSAGSGGTTRGTPPRVRPAADAPADARVVVDAALALDGEGAWPERWAAAMHAVRPALGWWRAAIVGPESWELSGDRSAPGRLSEHDVAQVFARTAEPCAVDLRAETSLCEHPTRVLHGLARALVAPVGDGSVLYLDRRAEEGPFGPADVELLRQVARLVAVRPPERVATADEAPGRFPEIVGRCAALDRLFAEMARVAHSEVPVHVFGETGTGKEKVARALHARSPRARGPFVAFNASSISDELFEAELF